MAGKFPNLFSPIRLRSVELRNRIIFPAHGTRLPLGQMPTERHVAYYGARAKGGAGLIIFELAPVYPPEPLESGPYISLHKPGAFEIMCRVADEVHRHDGRIVQQLCDQGRQRDGMEDLVPNLAPSAIPWFRGGLVPRPMSRRDVQEMIVAFVRAAELIRRAGFDGAELHAAHGYLIHQFMSPLSNQREDDYGGTLENRARFGLEVAQAVRAALGEHLILGMRMDAEEYVDGGLSLEEALQFARLYTQTGLIDYLSVSVGSYAAGLGRIIPPMYFPRGLYVPLAAKVKRSVDIPVAAVGRITEPEVADQIVGDGLADMVAMARALIADPELPRKAAEGRVEEIRHCVGTNECLNRNRKNWRIACTFNPDSGDELVAATRRPATITKKVLVVGGGPAGCEAARMSAERGHHVTLWEQSGRLGGQLNLAALAPGRDEFLEIPRFHEHELRRLGVDVHLGTTATSEQIREFAADTVVLAVGSAPVCPTEVPGIYDGIAIDCRTALREKVDLGNNVVVYIEAQHIQGLSVADRCASSGSAVTLATPYGGVGQELDSTTSDALIARLASKRVEVLLRQRLERIEGDSVILRHSLNGDVATLAGVTAIIYDCGSIPNSCLEQELIAMGIEPHVIGDCASPRNIMGAIKDGARVSAII